MFSHKSAFAHFWRIGACVSALVLAFGAMMTTAPAQEPFTVRLGTATPGGGFPVYGEAFAKAMQGADPALRIELRNTKGSTENIPLLEAGDLDVALVAGEPAYEAFRGIGRPATRLKIFAAMYSNPGMFVVRADSPAKSIRDLVGKPIAFGAKGSGLVILSRYVLDGLGLDQDKDFNAIYLDLAGDGPKMLADGSVAALWGAGRGWPVFKAASEQGGRFIAPAEDEIVRVRAKHSFLKPMTVPAGSYPGQTADIKSLGSWSFILVRADLPDDVAYRLARTLHAAEPAICAELAQACETTAANTADVADAARLHPGVLTYLRDGGFLK